jgi:hypothetical protein
MDLRIIIFKMKGLHWVMSLATCPFKILVSSMYITGWPLGEAGGKFTGVTALTMCYWTEHPLV